MNSMSIYCDNCGAANSLQAMACFACGLPVLQSQTSIEDIQGHTDALFKGRYRILSQTGTGGYGVVYKAIDTQANNAPVAIKSIHLAGLKPSAVIEATAAFNREVLLLHALHHAHLPRMHETFTDTEHWYLVMDFINGETLESYLDKTGNGRLPLAEVLNIGLQLCTVLHYLHTRQPTIIFRDLKPSNIMRTCIGHLYLIDFGIARHFKPGQAKDTIALGSPGYAAPEQYGKAQTTPRADIYSLGVVLHQLLTGNDPAETPFRLAPLQWLTPSIPSELETLISQMLELDEQKRPESAECVRQELERIVTKQQTEEAKALLASSYFQRPYIPPYGQQQQQIFAPSVPSPPKHVLSRRRVLVGLGALAVTGLGSAWIQQLTSSNGLIMQSSPSALTGDYTGHADIITGLAWSPDSSKVASASADKTVIISNVGNNTGARILTYRGHTKTVNAVAWSHGGQYIASASDDRTLQVWEAASGQFILGGRTKHVKALAWSPDDTSIAAVGYENTVQLWHIEHDVTSLIAHKNNLAMINTVTWSPDGKYIAYGGTGKLVQVWEIAAGKPHYSYKGAWKTVNDVAWSPDGRYIVAVGTSEKPADAIQLWDAHTGKPLELPPNLTISIVNSVSWSPDSTQFIFIGDADGTASSALIYTWNIATRQETNPNGGGVTAQTIAWSPNGHFIAAATTYNAVTTWQAFYDGGYGNKQ